MVLLKALDQTYLIAVLIDFEWGNQVHVFFKHLPLSELPTSASQQPNLLRRSPNMSAQWFVQCPPSKQLPRKSTGGYFKDKTVRTAPTALTRTPIICLLHTHCLPHTTAKLWIQLPIPRRKHTHNESSFKKRVLCSVLALHTASRSWLQCVYMGTVC